MDARDTSHELEEYQEDDDVRVGTALERIKQVSVALSDAARRKRLSSRGGFAAKRGSRWGRWLRIGGFLLLVVAPSAAAATYYYAFASDQFVSEAEFTVSVGQMPAKDDSSSSGSSSGSSSSGLASSAMLMIVQDTQIVVSYIHSRAALDKLDELIHVRDLYADPNVDFFARFAREKPIERFVKYWNRMSEAPIEMPGGIIHLKVRAFSPEAARKIAQATVDISEQLVNDMNSRINNDAVASAEQELDRASRRVAAALGALEVARNQSGIVETTKSADAITQLVKEARLNLLNLQTQYDTHLKDLSPTAPEMVQLNSRIEVTKKQLADIEARLTSNADDVPTLPGDATIAQAMTKFGALDLERKVAEEVYASAATSLEMARVNAENKLMYLKTFVSPTLPEEALYPKRALNTFIVVVGSLAVWGLLCALAAALRNRMS
jgi:capsular polysaccharide transport system permease protein